jgi:hypothetical protein
MEERSWFPLFSERRWHMTLSTFELAELRNLATAATCGPWHRDRLEPETVRTEQEGDIVIYETQHICDAAFIAAANPATILALLDMVEKPR